MKKGVNMWSFPAGMALEDCFLLAKRAGFQGVELALEEEGELSLHSAREQLVRIREMARDCGIELYSLATALFWKYPMTSPIPETAEKSPSIARTLLADAAVLGCPCALAVPGVVDEGTSYDDAYFRALAACRKLDREAQDANVCLCLENVWNKFLLSPLEFRRFIDEIGGGGTGVYFDVGNVRQWGYPEQWIRILGNRIRKVHIKDFRCAVGNGDGFVDLLSGDVDFPSVMRALRETGYDDWITAEICPPYRFAPAHTLTSISHAMDCILGM